MRVAVASFAFALTLTVVGCGSRRPSPPPPTPPPAPIVALTSPGPLASVHEDLACKDCHVEQSKQIDNNKCVYCHAHQPLAAMIGANRGLHASRLVAGKSCATCHLDHRGRTYEQLGWPALSGGRDKFDHAYTGWPLVAAHAVVTCDACHTRVTAQGRTRYLGTDRACVACHQNQPHGVVRRDLLACERCHTVAAWQPPKAKLAFDHDDRHDARVPLLAAHRAVACAKCHPNAKLNLAMADPNACDACHQSPHAGTINTTRPCAQCHTPVFEKFSSTLFDHTERTRFDLGLSHNKLDCSACHTKALGMKEPSAACETCHSNRSPHKDRFKGIACAACHVSSAPYNPKSPTHPPWRVGAFDHAKNGNWQLRQKHAELICRTCHRGSAPWDFERLAPGTDCKGCHEHAVVHSDNAHPTGKYTSQQCLQCHR